MATPKNWFNKQVERQQRQWQAMFRYARQQDRANRRAALTRAKQEQQRYSTALSHYKQNKAQAIEEYNRALGAYTEQRGFYKQIMEDPTQTKGWQSWQENMGLQYQDAAIKAQRNAAKSGMVGGSLSKMLGDIESKKAQAFSSQLATLAQIAEKAYFGTKGPQMRNVVLNYQGGPLSTGINQFGMYQPLPITQPQPPPTGLAPAGEGGTEGSSGLSGLGLMQPSSLSTTPTSPTTTASAPSQLLQQLSQTMVRPNQLGLSGAASGPSAPANTSTLQGFTLDANQFTSSDPSQLLGAFDQAGTTALQGSTSQQASSAPNITSLQSVKIPQALRKLFK